MSAQKILCLHGFVQNGSVFARKSSGLRKALGKLGYETVYLNAPVKVSGDDLPFDTSASTFGSEESSASDFRSWWPYNIASQDHYTIDQALETIKTSIEEDGPYVGVIGFSQGAGLAGILCNIIETLSPKQGPFKFAVFYSGFRAQPEALQHYYDKKITTPSLHILGSLDTVVSEERSMKLYDACTEDTRQLLNHPGGHFVPNSKPLVKSVLDFVTASNTEEKKEDEKKDDSPDWDEFDKIGQA